MHLIFLQELSSLVRGLVTTTKSLLFSPLDLPKKLEMSDLPRRKLKAHKNNLETHILPIFFNTFFI